MQKLRLQDQHPALQAAVADPTVCLVYRPGSRLYCIPRLFRGYTPRRYGYPPGPRAAHFSVHLIGFCPFSGDLLPGEISDMRERRLKRRNGLTVMDIMADARRLPKWAISEDWWVNERIGPVHDQELLDDMMSVPPKEPYLDEETIQAMENSRPPGYRFYLDDPEHHCGGLASIFGTESGMYRHLPFTREYGPRIIDPNKRIDDQPIRILPVPYCPWCGTKLPESKRSEWEKRVRKVGFDPDNPEAEGFPQELLRDAWWREAGL